MGFDAEVGIAYYGALLEVRVLFVLIIRFGLDGCGVGGEGYGRCVRRVIVCGVGVCAMVDFNYQ